MRLYSAGLSHLDEQHVGHWLDAMSLDSALISLVFRSARPHLTAPRVLRLLCSQHTSRTVRLPPPSPLTSFPAAGRSDYAIGTLLTGQQLQSEPKRARSASRARCLRVDGCVHVCARQRLSRACRAHCAWSRGLLPVVPDARLRCASDRVRHATCDSRAGERGRTTHDHS